MGGEIVELIVETTPMEKLLDALNFDNAEELMPCIIVYSSTMQYIY